MLTGECKCGTCAKPCQSKVRVYLIAYRLSYIYNFIFSKLYKYRFCLIFAQGTADKPETVQRAPGSLCKRQGQGFRLTHSLAESEEMQRAEKHENVKVQMLCMFL